MITQKMSHKVAEEILPLHSVRYVPDTVKTTDLLRQMYIASQL